MLISEQLFPKNKRLDQIEINKLESPWVYINKPNELLIEKMRERLLEYHKALEALEKQIKENDKEREGTKSE